MSEKPKRKNDQPIPRRYWWFFGVLATLLLVGLWFPIRLLTWYELNFILYVLIGVACFLMLIHFIRRFHWRRGVTILILLCILLTGLNIVEMVNNSYTAMVVPQSCSSEDFGILSFADCITQGTGCFVVAVSYVGIRGIPIVIQTHIYMDGTCSLF
jgi:hypothetical protein